MLAVVPLPLALLLALAPAPARAPAAAPAASAEMRIDALLAEAWAQSPAVMRARADVEAAQAALAGASVWLPNPEIEGAFLTDAPFANEGELDVDVRLVQEIAWPGGRFARAAAGESSVRAARARWAAARLEVAASVERAVADVVAARAAQATRGELVRVARAMGESARRKLEAGSIGALEATLVKADAASAESSALFAGAQVALAERALCETLGRTACAPAPLDWPALVDVDTTTATATSGALRFDVSAAEADQDAAAKRADAAGLAWLPTMRVGAGYALERGIVNLPDGGDAILDPDQMLGLSLSITLPVWDWRRQDVLAARADATRAEADAREAALRAQSAAPAARAAFAAATAAVERLAVVQDEIAQALADLERAYDAGALPLDQALTARDRLLQARLDAVEAQRRRVSAHADVLRALSLPLVAGVADEAETP